MFSALPRRVAVAARAARSTRAFSAVATTVVGHGFSGAPPHLAAGAAAVSVAAAAALALSLQREKTFVAAETNLTALEKRVADLEIAAGGSAHTAYVFIKPHAVYDKVKELVKLKFECSGISVLSEGAIAAEKIDKEQLIDTHYGAIAAKAVKLQPASLTVQPKAKEEFQKVFGLAWEDALTQGLVYNAMDATKKLNVSTKGLGEKWGKLKVNVDMLKFGGGFYCGKMDGIYVINGFYMNMRSTFTVPGECIYYYEVEWDPKKLSWADFRAKILGGTDPKTADLNSVRHLIYGNWEGLGLKSCPNTGDNGVHASASPFEALAERSNWLGKPLAQDTFGKAMLAAGVPLPMLKVWCDDPPVIFEGKKQSIFDLLEDMNAPDCIKKAAAIASAN